jgi:ubiquinone/menaquinone biosynthesis C-methylase UbiE
VDFTNAYGDDRRAAAYDQLELGRTYDLVFRDFAELLERHVNGKRALDFGCGTGRTGRLLRALGFETTGVDISESMIKIARKKDPDGDYRVIDDGDFSSLPEGGFDMILSAFTFDNIPGLEHRTNLFTGLRKLLAPAGRMVNLVSTPEMYTHEWVTFSTKDFPENKNARCGDVVRIYTTDYDDARPVDDILWPDADYRALYRAAGLEVLHHDTPLAKGDEGIAWINETKIAPWARYVLGAAAR